MAFLALFKPVETLTDDQRRRGLRDITLHAGVSAGADGLASAGFLAAFALILGASTFHIGIMTAVPFLMQPLQLFAVIVIERLRAQKVIAVAAYVLAFAAWVPIALIPFAIDVPNAGAISLLLFFIAVEGGASAFVIASWNGWLHDIVPQHIMGGFFAHRLRIATIAAASTSLAAALFIDWWTGTVPEADVIFGYSYAMLGSILLGLGSIGLVARIPEPRMARPEGRGPSVLQSLAAPFKDRDFRRLINHQFMWNFVAYLAVPFFAVYMLTVLELSLSVVVGLGVLSQVTSILFYRVWGPLVDRYGSKVVLSISSSLYFLVILGWTFTTMPGRYALTIPLLVLLHALIGIAGAGAGLSSTTIRMKMAPRAQATSFLTAASLAANLGAGIAPLIGGAFIDFFSVRHLEIGVEWVDPSRTIDFPAIFLTGYDFLFAIAFVLGLSTIGILGGIKEEGEAESRVVMDELMAQARENLQSLNAVPGIGFLSHLPIVRLRYLPNIPGLDVAVGVTAYQIASSARYAVETLTQGGATAKQVQAHLSRTVARAAQETGGGARHGAEIAFGTAQEAVNAAARAGPGRLIQAVVGGTLDALGRTAANPLDTVRGTVYGAIYGAQGAGVSVGSAVAQSIQAAREAASRLGLSEHEAAKYAAQAAVEAATELTGESGSEVREAVLNELMGDTGEGGGPKA